MTKATMKEWVNAVGEHGSFLRFKDGHINGAVFTPLGIVHVICDHKFSQFTFLRCMKGGLVYTRSFDKAYSRRYLVTLAKRFISDVMESDE